MRLSDYPYVVVRIACSKCARKGRCRLARLADRYGSEIEMPMLLSHLAGDCSRRDAHHPIYDHCGAFFPDIAGALPPDHPPSLMKLRLVR